MKMTKDTVVKSGIVLAILAVGFTGMLLLGSSEVKSNKRIVDPEVRAVKTAAVEYNNMQLKVKGNGVIVPEKELSVVAEASGVVLFAKNDLKNGTYVSKDEVIVEIDSREVKNNLFSLRSDFMNTVASVLPELKVEDKNVYDKWNDYFKSLEIDREVPPLPEVANSQEKIKISSRGLFSKYFAVKNQEILFSKHTVKAPFDGFLKSQGIVEKSYINKGQELFSLTDAKNMEIAVPLLVEEYDMINFGGAVPVKIYSEGNDGYITGKIERKDTKLERNSQTLNVYVSFSNNKLDPRFMAGNYVHVAITGKTLKDVAMLPRQVVDSENHVYTMEEGSLNRRPVEIAALQDDYVLIQKSLPEDTRIITTILQKPLLGMKVRELEEELKLTETSGGNTSETKTIN